MKKIIRFILFSLLNSALGYRGSINEIVEKHNYYRKLHGSQLLNLDPSLIKLAQNYANELKRNNTFTHGGLIDSQGRRVGQNLALLCCNMNITKAVDLWYNEIKNYNYNKPGFSMNTGHFTQVVWNNSAQIGIGIAESKDGKIYVVGDYFPPGNVQNQFPKNVFPLKK